MKKLIVFITVVLCFNLKGQIPTSGLTGYWPFNAIDHANDLSGNANNGTVYGAVLTTDRFGNCNEAYKFNGINNRIIVPNSPTVDMYNTDFTIAVWEKTYPGDTVGPILQ